MPLRSFKIENQKSIGLAECNAVPPIMIISGPNGVGKSTLLHCLKKQNGGDFDITGSILYLGPHRILRRQQVQKNDSSGEKTFRYYSALELESFSGKHGLQILGIRVPASLDEAMSYIKYAISQIEITRRDAIADMVDKNNLTFPTGKFPDLYESLREITSQLLPHLEFSRVDISDNNNVKCLWKRSVDPDLTYTNYIEIDIDELPSGEKAVIGLFFPFVEYKIKEILSRLQSETVTTDKRDVIFLIDEPLDYIYIHPCLSIC